MVTPRQEAILQRVGVAVGPGRATDRLHHLRHLPCMLGQSRPVLVIGKEGLTFLSIEV